MHGGFGIGDFGGSAYQFVDFLAECGQAYWQILPIGYIGYANSPYQCYGSKALNPYFIDPYGFSNEGLCSRNYLDGLGLTLNSGRVDYNEVFRVKNMIFDRAFGGFNLERADYIDFKSRHKDWLDDFALFIVLLKKTKNLTIMEFAPDIQKRDPVALGHVLAKFGNEVEREKFLQFFAFRQWMGLREYANGKGIKIIGDIPIYLSFDSVEVWTDRELFKMGPDLEMKQVSGVPPDKMSDKGQIWGNPVYDWRYHARTGYGWWIDRISFSLSLFDIIRIDHFRGFAKYYVVEEPFDDAHKGKWKKGPGFWLFRKVNRIFDSSRIIAEDLGHITRDVRRLIRRTGYCGMKVAQFGFSGDRDNEHHPRNYPARSFSYTGTHDNNTIIGWYADMPPGDRMILEKMVAGISGDNANLRIIEMLMKSDSQAVIVPMQDYLGLGSSARMNTPSTVSGNWEWRMTGIPPETSGIVISLTEKRKVDNE
ncbi:MAG: 4-alpha-glucanotransferase [Clostridia bacterium]|nr:4-alpha-glucanotransferase [Clostridia bacterium]